MTEPALETALDELYGVDPSEFVATRKRLAGELRSAGDKAAAKDLLAVRRPSTSAWALNELARRQPELVETLLDRSSELVAAQTRALSGKPDAMRAAIRAHRDALDAATAGALEILGSRANDGFRGEIVSTLRAASSDEDVERQLRSGRVIREVSASGFPDDTGLVLVASAPPTRTKPAAKPKVGKADPQVDAKPSAADAAKARKAAEAEAAAKAEAEAAARREAKRAAEERRARLAEAERERDAARAALKEIEARITRLKSEL